MIEWNKPEDKLPEIEFIKNHSNEYYLVLLENGCTNKAMYTDFGWCPDYSTTLIKKVIGWTEINNDFKYLYYDDLFSDGAQRRRILREDNENFYIEDFGDNKEKVVSKEAMMITPEESMLKIKYMEETEELLTRFKNIWKSRSKES